MPNKKTNSDKDEGDHEKEQEFGVKQKNTKLFSYVPIKPVFI